MTGNSAALTILAILAHTGTQCDGTNQGQHATHAVNDGRTGKIVEHITKGSHHKAVGSIVAKPAATPGPVPLYGVDDQRDNGAVNQIHRELGALGHSTAHDGGTGGTEHSFENQEALNRQVALVETQVAPVGHTDKAAQHVVAKHKSEAQEEEQQRAEHKIYKVFHQNVGCVLTASKSRFTQCKTRLHPEHQHRSQQHPYGIE